jgi:hypothetical protein
MSDYAGTDEELPGLLTDVFACNRVWSAWEIGTMTAEDFTPAGTDEDVLGDLIAWRDAAVAAERDKPGRPSRAWHADWVPVDRDSSGNAILRHKPTGGMYKILPVEEC